MKKTLSIFLLILLTGTAYTQLIPQVHIPRPGTMPTYKNIDQPHVNNPSPTVSTPYQPGGQGTSVHDPGRLRQQNEMHRQIREEVEAHQREIRETEERAKLLNTLIYEGFPSWKEAPGTENFYAAYRELEKMLNGETSPDLSKAIFITENAFLDNSLRYTDFAEVIQQKASLCWRRLHDLKLNPKDKLAQNMAIFSLLTDTLSISQPGTETTITHYPLTYNHEDFDSRKNYTSHFVSTLLDTNVGQCYSMPLLYLLIAEKMGAEAYLSYAPHHSFIKIKDDKGAWYNLELTCRHILSDYHYMNHSYIKSEAIRNKLYLMPMDKKETVATLLIQLGRYYLVKYGYDPFVVACAGKALGYLPNSIDALILQADYETRLTLEIARLIGAPNPQAMKEISPDAYSHYLKMQSLYTRMDNTGYEDTPPEIYQNWLDHITREKDK